MFSVTFFKSKDVSSCSRLSSYWTLHIPLYSTITADNSNGHFSSHNKRSAVDMAAVRCRDLPSVCFGSFINCSQINSRITHKGI